MPNLATWVAPFANQRVNPMKKEYGDMAVSPAQISPQQSLMDMQSKAIPLGVKPAPMAKGGKVYCKGSGTRSVKS